MKKVFFVIIVVVLIFGVVFVTSSLVDSKKTNHEEISTRNFVGDKVLVQKMESLYNTNLQRDLRVDDLNGIDAMVEGDHFAEDEFKELKWFIENKETLHISHSITALEVYASTGKKVFCITDAASHLRVYIRHNEEDLLLDNLKELPKELKDWQKNVKESQTKDATYFKNFEDIKNRVNDVLPRINKGDRSKQVSSDLYYIELYGVC